MRCANSSGEIIFSFSAWFSLLVLTPSNMTQALCSSVGVKGFLMLSNVTSPLLILLRSARYSLEYGRFRSAHSVTYGRLVLIYIILFYTETTGTYLVCDMPASGNDVQSSLSSQSSWWLGGLSGLLKHTQKP